MQYKLEGIQKREPMKVGRKTVAEVLTHKNGLKMLMVYRTSKDIIRGKGNTMISHGIEENSACWPVETLLLSRMKRRDINLLVIKERDTKALHVSRLCDWINHSTTYTRRKRNGSFQRILPFGYFINKLGKIKL